LLAVYYNRTTRQQLSKVFPDFVSRWPTPADLLKADEQEIAALIKPLGFSTRRTAGLLKLATAYLDNEWKNVRELPGVGEYAAAAHSIFIKNIVPEHVNDHALAHYVEWWYKQR
jgi:methyl-CpG-binding domain protein 4